jgi:hypothetical protein
MIKDKEGKACQKCIRRFTDCPVVCPEKDFEVCFSCIHGIMTKITFEKQEVGDEDDVV